MRHFVLGCSALMVALMATVATADDGDKDQGKHPDRGPEFRQKMLEKFDADKDGKLNDEEHAKARKAMQERFGRGGPGKGDPGDKARRGPGRGGPGGPPPGVDPKKMHEMMLKKFDADKDGKLNDEEHAKARKAMQERFGRGGPGRGGPGDKARRGPGRGGPGGPHSGIDPKKMHERMLKKFDADKDGKLNDEERGKARKAMQERFGRGGPGKGDPGDKARRGRGPGPGGPHSGIDPKKMHEMMLKKFDADKDGKLSDEEREKARKTVHERFRRGGPGKGGPGDQARRGRGPERYHRFHGSAHGGPGAKRGPGPHGPPHGPGHPPTQVKTILQIVALIDINGDGKLDDREVHIAHARIDQIAGRSGSGPPRRMRHGKRDGGPPHAMRHGKRDGGPPPWARDGMRRGPHHGDGPAKRPGHPGGPPK